MADAAAPNAPMTAKSTPRELPEQIQIKSVPAPIQKEKAAVSAEQPILQAVDSSLLAAAAPLPAQAPTAANTVAAVEIDPAAASARTAELTEAVAAIADTITVTPALVRGDGEVVIRLKPTVLDGSEIRIEAKGSAIAIDIRPATDEVAHIVERSQAQLAQQLSERIPSFQFTIATTPRQTLARKLTTDETN